MPDLSEARSGGGPQACRVGTHADASAAHRAKMGDCHPFPFFLAHPKPAFHRKEIGWLSPFFASSDFHRGRLSNKAQE